MYFVRLFISLETQSLLVSSSLPWWKCICQALQPQDRIKILPSQRRLKPGKTVNISHYPLTQEIWPSKYLCASNRGAKRILQNSSAEIVGKYQPPMTYWITCEHLKKEFNFRNAWWAEEGGPSCSWKNSALLSCFSSSYLLGSIFWLPRQTWAFLHMCSLSLSVWPLDLFIIPHFNSSGRELDFSFLYCRCIEEHLGHSRCSSICWMKKRKNAYLYYSIYHPESLIHLPFSSTRSWVPWVRGLTYSYPSPQQWAVSGIQ